MLFFEALSLRFDSHLRAINSCVGQSIGGFAPASIGPPVVGRLDWSPRLVGPFSWIQSYQKKSVNIFTSSCYIDVDTGHCEFWGSCLFCSIQPICA